MTKTNFTDSNFHTCSSIVLKLTSSKHFKTNLLTNKQNLSYFRHFFIFFVKKKDYQSSQSYIKFNKSPFFATKGANALQTFRTKLADNQMPTHIVQMGFFFLHANNALLCWRTIEPSFLSFLGFYPNIVLLFFYLNHFYRLNFLTFSLSLLGWKNLTIFMLILHLHNSTLIKFLKELICHLFYS